MNYLCKECNCEMVDGYKIKLHNTAILAYATLKKDGDEKTIKAMICPNCGEVKFYAE